MKSVAFERSRFAVPCACLALFVAAIAWPEPAWAIRLEVSAEAPAWAHVGAAILLWLHIGGGTVGLLSGIVAIAAHKGSPAHRLAGKVFLGSMFVAYLIGAGVAPFLDEQQRPNFIGGLLALYLLLSGVSAAWRRRFVAGAAEKAGLVVALTIAGMGVWFVIEGAKSPTGTVDGSPPQAFILFIVVGSIAAVGEINALVRGTLPPASRMVRHLWRMCTSLFIASGSLFLGQPQVFPDWWMASPLPWLCAFAPLVVLVYAVSKVRWQARHAASAA